MNNSSDESNTSSLGSNLSDSLPMNSLNEIHQDIIPQPEVIIDNPDINNSSNNNRFNSDNNIQIHPPSNPRSGQFFFTFPFIIFLIFNTLGLIHSFFTSFNQTDYSFSLWCIIHKEQYYRMLTHHFSHLSFLHYAFSMVAYYFLSKRIENQIGSLYTFLLTIQSIVFISVIYLLILLLAKISHISTLDCNFHLQKGFTCVCIFLYQFYYLLTRNRDETIDLLLFSIRPKHSTIVFIILLQIIVPRLSIIGHISGYFVAHITYKWLSYISFPDKEWIREFEECCCLEKNNFVQCVVLYVPIDAFNEENVNEISCFLQFQNSKEYFQQLISSLVNRKTGNRSDDSAENIQNKREDNASNSNGMSSNQHIEMNEERLDGDV